MNHYFTEDNKTLKSNPHVIAFSVKNTPLKFNTDHGVFSMNNLDRGTEVLLQYLEVNSKVKRVLDLGTGYGVVGIYISKIYNVEVDMVDINERALDLAKSNLMLNEVKGNVFKSDICSNVTSKYDLIITNPPIRAGKKTVYHFFDQAANHLTEIGELFVVINKKHGAESAITKLETIFEKVDIIGRKKGFYVLKCKNRLTI